MRERTFVVLICACLTACSATRTRVPEQNTPEPSESDVPTPIPDTSVERVDVPVVSVLDVAPDSGGVVTGVGCSGPASTATGWWRDAMVYEIFVRSFQDSDADGIGDLDGIRARLDYLNDGNPDTDTDLEVTALWLMPIHPSPSYHGYDVTDYRSVNAEYGTAEDLDALVAAAATRGISVMLDLVLNHTSDKHPWFVKGKRAGAAEFQDHYLFRDTPPEAGWGQPWAMASSVWHPVGDRWFYGLFWEGMPDLNVANPVVAAELVDVAKFWKSRGIKGLRLDAARYLIENGPGALQADQPETHAFWRTLRATLGQDVLLLGEAWTDLATTLTYFGQDDELQALFGFDRTQTVRDSLRLGTATAFGTALCAELAGPTGRGVFASFLGNHDLDRLASVISSPASLRLGAVLLFTLPGLPVIYYGEELGLPNGGAGGDLGKRLPMRWDASARHGFTEAESAWEGDSANAAIQSVAEQGADPSSVLALYRRLTRARSASEALRTGATTRLLMDSSAAFAFVRHTATELVLVVANFGDASLQELEVDLSSFGVLGAGTDLLGDEGAPTPAARMDLGPLAPQTARVVRYPRLQ